MSLRVPGCASRRDQAGGGREGISPARAAYSTGVSGHARRGRRPALAPAPAPDPAAQIDEAQALVARIAAGELDAELVALHDAVAQRLATLRAIESAAALLSFHPGGRVRLNCAARPNYLHGALGTVTGLVGQQVIVALDGPIGRFRSGRLRCPPLTLDKLSAGTT